MRPPTKGIIMDENQNENQTEVGYPHIIVGALALVGTVVVAKKAINIGRRVTRAAHVRAAAAKSDSLWASASDNLN